jgi:hypothetical protein
MFRGIGPNGALNAYVSWLPMDSIIDVLPYEPSFQCHIFKMDWTFQFRDGALKRKVGFAWSFFESNNLIARNWN